VTNLPEGVMWLGDGTQVENVENNWLKTFPPNLRKTSDPVIYRFSSEWIMYCHRHPTQSH
jgi:hypothetical protein